MLLTLAMMTVEIAAGWSFNSMALLADGWHMGTHAAALGISWMAFALSRRHAADRSFVFGTWKIEVLGGFVSAVLLGLVGLAMGGVSLHRLFQPLDIRFTEAITVAVLGLAVNLVSIFLLRERRHDEGRAHGHGGHAHESLNLRAAYIHVLADALTSVLAIAALAGGRFFGWNWLDAVMGIVGACLVLRWSCALLADTGGILLDREADGERVAAIRAMIEAAGDARVSDLHVWQVGPGRYACIVALTAFRPAPVAHYKRLLSGMAEMVHITVEVTGASAPDAR